MKYTYTALFYNDCGKVAFHFPFDESLHSFGDDLDEAILAAEEILSDYLWDLQRQGKDLPADLCPLEVPRLVLLKEIQADTDQYAAALERTQIEQAPNPIRALLDLKHMKIKELADALDAPYRTAQDWSLGKSKPPKWALNLILDKFL